MTTSDVTTAPPVRLSRRWPRIIWGVILSLGWPGLGQIYARSWRLGIGLLSLNLALWATIAGVCHGTLNRVSLALFVILVVIYWALKFGAAIDVGRRLARQTTRARPRWFRSTWLAAVVTMTLSSAVYKAIPAAWTSFWVPADSMSPTLQVGDVFVSEMFGPQLSLDRGDIIVLHPVNDPKVVYTKRVIGLPGDRVALNGVDVILNGEAVPRVADREAAPPPAHRWIETLPNGHAFTIQTLSPGRATPTYVVPPGSLFVLGDNRDNSLDSRFAQFGYVPIRNVVAKNGVISWSWSRSRLFSALQ